jgi:hypothetical protein
MAPTPDTPSPETGPGRSSEKPRRRPFEGQAAPEPFSRTPEFQRFVWLAGVLGVVSILAYVFLSGAARRLESPQAKKGAPITAEVQAERQKNLETLFEGSLTDTRNGEGFAETQGYEHLLQLLEGYPPDQVAALATRKLDWDAAVADPDAWRGQFVWTRGIVAHRWAERLKNPVSGFEDVYRAILTDGDGSEGVVVDMLQEPPQVGLQSDPVDVQGIFYRTVKYRNAARNSVEVEAPYLLVKTMRPVIQPPKSPTGVLRDPKVMGLIAIALVIGVARLLIYVFQRRTRRPGRVAPTGAGAGARPGSPGFRNLFEQRIHENDRPAGPRSES